VSRNVLTPRVPLFFSYVRMRMQLVSSDSQQNSDTAMLAHMPRRL
jgi:hypothetical protein